MGDVTLMLPSSSTVRWLIFALLAVVALMALLDEQQLAPTEEKPGQQTTALTTTSDLANKPPRGNFAWDSFQITEMSSREVKEKRNAIQSHKQGRRLLGGG